MTLRGPDGRRYPPRMVPANLADPGTFRSHLMGIARLEAPTLSPADQDWIGEFELEITDPAIPGSSPIRMRW